VAALARAGRLDEAESLVEQFASWARGRNAPGPSAALSTCRALVAEGRGDRVAAALHADAAAEWAALPRPYDELLSLERRGRCLLGSGDQARGLSVLADCQQRLRRLGASWDADRVAHVLRQQGVEVARPWRRGPRGYGDRLSPRELEVVALVARGLTNRQVGEALFLSPKTVDRHLSTSMRKLGVSSRTALAIAAIEARLLPSGTAEPAT
jgi:DNA-binding CsgD family transcriptional regulator